MCSKGILIKDGECLESNKCTIANCDYCSVDKQNQEICNKCSHDYSIKISNGKHSCV